LVTRSPERTIQKGHSFRNYFTLVKNVRNKSNATAVCNFCAAEYGGVQAALLISGASAANKGVYVEHILQNARILRITLMPKNETEY
jgi:hypothetical protein